MMPPSWNQVEQTRVGGHQIAWRRIGEGTPVLLLHGVTTGSFIWRRVAEPLSKHHDVIAPDLLGVGGSDRPVDVDNSVATQAVLMRELVVELGLPPIHLVGHDVGGGIAQIMAVRYPELVSDMTLINSVGYDYWPVQPIITLRTPMIRQLAMATLDRGVLRMVIRRGLFHKERVTDELLQLFREHVSADRARKAFLHFLRCLNNRQLMEIVPDLQRLDKPVLIIRGDADVYLSEKISMRLDQEIPGSCLVRISTAGHFIQEDEPDLVADTMVEFFKRANGTDE